MLSKNEKKKKKKMNILTENEKKWGAMKKMKKNEEWTACKYLWRILM